MGVEIVPSFRLGAGESSVGSGWTAGELNGGEEVDDRELQAAS